MDSKTLSLRTLVEECVARFRKCKIGYFAFAGLGLGLGSIGVWAPLVFNMSTEEGSHLVSLLTYGFAIAGGMLLNVLLNSDRNREFTIVGSLAVGVGLFLLLNPFFRSGPYPGMTYVGMLLLILVWGLANVEDYEERVKSSARFALGEGDGDDIGGKGI